MKKKAILYPYDREAAPLLRSLNFNDTYQLVGVVSMPGWGYDAKDAAVADGGPTIGINVESSFEESLESCDSVIFILPEHIYNFENDILTKITLAKSSGKEIVCLFEINQIPYFIQKDFDTCIFYNGTDFTLSNQMEELYGINTPVVTVLGLSTDVDKFYTEIILQNQLIQKGYRVSTIGSRPYGDLLGMHSYPRFMFDSGLSEREKIYGFNEYVKSIEESESPDIIVLGIPGGIIPYGRFIDNYFGITAFEVMQAVVSDVCVFNMYFDDYSPEYLNKMNDIMKYRFGMEIDIFNIINKRVDKMAMSSHPRAIETFRVNSKKVEDRVSKLSINSQKAVTALVDPDSKIGDMIVDLLSVAEEGHIVVF